MARKVVSRKELRAEAEAAEAAEKAAPKKKKTAKKKTTRAKAADVRLKAYWGVFNQSLKRVALYDYAQRKEAEKKAKELTDKGKSPHFVQPVKEVLDEA